MDFVTGLLILKNWKNESYKSILVIVDCLIKIIYYKFIKITIDIVRSNLVEVIMNMMMCQHNILKLIVIN